MSKKSRLSTSQVENLPALPGKVQVVRHAPAHAHSASAQNMGFTPQLVFMALRRWWLVALPIGLVLASAAAVVVWYQFVPEFQASAQVQIASQRPMIAFDLKGPPYGRNDTNVDTHLNLLQSNIVLLGSSSYLKQPGAKSVVQQLLDDQISGWSRIEAMHKELIASRNLDPTSRQIFLADWLRKGIQVSPSGKGSSIYSVSFKSRDAEFSQAVVNTIVRTYFDILKAQRGEQDQGLLELLRAERDTRHPQLAAKQAELDRLIADEMRTGAFVELAPEAGDPRLPLRAQLLEAELEKAVIAAEAISLSRAAEKPIEISEDRIEQSVEQDPYVRGLRRQTRELSRLSADIDNSAVPEDTPESLAIRSHIEDLAEELDAYQDELRPQVREELLAAEQQSRAAALEAIEARRKNNEAMLAALKQQQEKILEDLTAGSSASLEIEREKFELDLERDVLARIENRIIQLETESAAPAQIELWRWADKPITPIAELPYKQWLVAVVLALLAPFLLAVGWERILQRVYSPDTLEKDLDLEVMGEIARFPRKRMIAASGSDRSLDSALSVFEESVDTLGTSLRLAGDIENIHVLAVTSASSHEGKTSVAAQLAISISHTTKEKTLLVDGDMRSPDIHRVFGLAPEPGLEDVLSGDCDPAEAIITDWSENLHILPAGKLGSNPHRLLANGIARSLFARLTEEYRYIIVDTPPVLAAGETLILCKAADATLMCTMWDVTRTDRLRRACKRLSMAGVQLTGTILNGVPASRYVHRYGQYHAFS